jgi:hypothetical protein
MKEDEKTLVAMTSTWKHKVNKKWKIIFWKSIFSRSIKFHNLQCKVLSKLLVSLFNLTKNPKINQYEATINDALLSIIFFWCFSCFNKSYMGELRSYCTVEFRTRKRLYLNLYSTNFDNAFLNTY